MGTPPSQGGQPQSRDPMQTDKYTQPMTKPTQPQSYAPSPPTPPSQLTPEKKRGGARWLLLVAGLALIGGGAYTFMGGTFGFLGGGDDAPVKALSGFYSSLDAGKCDDARNLLASPDMTAQQLCDRWKALKDAGPTSTGASDKASVSGDTATVSWLMTAGGKSNNRTISLRKTNNAWKITTPTSELLPAP